MAGAPIKPESNCPLCPRLATFRAEWRKREPAWYNSPVDSFGPVTARLLIVGLAPGLQGANRTGRPFTGDYAGTVAFTSRAQLTDFEYAEPAVDVWSTAASLYWMLTESTPRDFPAGREPVLVVLQDDPVPIRERNPEIPTTVAAVIDAALVDRPDIEVRTAAEFARLLRDAMGAR